MNDPNALSALTSIYQGGFFDLAKESAGRLSVAYNEKTGYEASLNGVKIISGQGWIELSGKGKTKLLAIRHLADQYHTAKDLGVLLVI